MPINAAAITPEQTAPIPAAMSRRDVNFAMAGLTLSLFVAGLSNLVVLTAMPRIVAELHGGQASYTWIVTSSMLAITVCTPFWGRMSDMLDKKRLLQLCVAGYVVSSMIAGFAGATWVIIVCRIGIGVCAAGIIVFMQAIAAQITTPRHRARWIGYRSAAMSVATVGAPTLGGVLAQHLGWRACFFVGVPPAIVAILMTQFTLRLPPPVAQGSRRIDWPGALLVSGGLVTLMLWVSLVGPDRGWGSLPAGLTLAAALVALTAGILVELRHPAAMLPLELLRDRPVLLCTIAAAGTGFAYFGSAVFLAIYLQIGRGYSPQTAGLMALPEAVATVGAALLAARFISGRGRYKAVLIVGGAMICAGFGLLVSIGTGTSLLFIGLCVALIGGGLGVVAENLVLIVQTVVSRSKAGSAGALVAFCRVTGGVTCVAALGTILSAHVADRLRDSGLAFDPHAVPKLAALPFAERVLVESAYADGIARVYLACFLVALILLVSLCLLPARSIDEEID